jgi:hypothetical protein
MCPILHVYNMGRDSALLGTGDAGQALSAKGRLYKSSDDMSKYSYY